MSREERRQYQRMMKNMERGPALPPAARARQQRNQERRARATAAPPGSFTRRFVVVSALVALAAGFTAFSLQWPNMPFAAYVGVAVTTVVLALAFGFRLLQRRAARST
jgi:hypothetical protein